MQSNRAAKPLTVTGIRTKYTICRITSAITFNRFKSIDDHFMKCSETWPNQQLS